MLKDSVFDYHIFNERAKNRLTLRKIKVHSEIFKLRGDSKLSSCPNVIKSEEYSYELICNLLREPSTQLIKSAKSLLHYLNNEDNHIIFEENNEEMLMLTIKFFMSSLCTNFSDENHPMKLLKSQEKISFYCELFSALSEKILTSSRFAAELTFSSLITKLSRSIACLADLLQSAEVSLRLTFFQEFFKFISRLTAFKGFEAETSLDFDNIISCYFEILLGSYSREAVQNYLMTLNYLEPIFLKLLSSNKAGLKLQKVFINLLAWSYRIIFAKGQHDQSEERSLSKSFLKTIKLVYCFRTKKEHYYLHIDTDYIKFMFRILEEINSVRLNRRSDNCTPLNLASLKDKTLSNLEEILVKVIFNAFCVIESSTALLFEDKSALFIQILKLLSYKIEDSLETVCKLVDIAIVSIAFSSKENIYLYMLILEKLFSVQLITMRKVMDSYFYLYYYLYQSCEQNRLILQDHPKYYEKMIQCLIDPVFRHQNDPELINLEIALHVSIFSFDSGETHFTRNLLFIFQQHSFFEFLNEIESDRILKSDIEAQIKRLIKCASNAICN